MEQKMTINQPRRDFMVGAAGLTLGFAAAPALLMGDAQAQNTRVKMNNWVTIHTDGTVAIMSPASDRKSTRLNSSH